ncbi:NAD-P-binding protein [Apiospora aurea]|uniref:NAD-P-binding protein n=1 Tax=Apiospora aurea TaxID=335848 RepID=A0ABR1QYG0_9PEZI
MISIVYNYTYVGIDPAKFYMRGKSIFNSNAVRGFCKVVALFFTKAGASQIAIGAGSDLQGRTSTFQN